MTELDREFRNRLLSEISESPELADKKRKTIDVISSHLELMKSKYQKEYEIFLGGSQAKGTEIRNSDIDIFLLFQNEFDQKEILGMLKKEFPEGKEEYSEHPYLILDRKEYSIDLVPAFMATSTDSLKTSVDRTPFHVRFVKDNFTDEMKNEVKILKQFMKTLGVYGAESSIQGFSGYVAELIIYHYKTFGEAIEKISKWDIPFYLDKSDKDFPGSSLVIVDPVDLERNTAANVSIENLSTIILAAKLFPYRPKNLFFTVDRLSSTIPNDAVVLSVPCRRCNQEILGPNLRRISAVLGRELEMAGFVIMYSSVFVADGRGYIILVPNSEVLGEASLHLGPPVTSPNVIDYLEKWGNGSKFGPPFMVGNRIAVLKERYPRRITEAIADLVPKLKFSVDFFPAKMVIVTGRDLSRLPDSVKNHVIEPSLGRWARPSGNIE